MVFDIGLSLDEIN